MKWFSIWKCYLSEILSVTKLGTCLYDGLWKRQKMVQSAQQISLTSITEGKPMFSARDLFCSKTRHGPTSLHTKPAIVEASIKLKWTLATNNFKPMPQSWRKVSCAKKIHPPGLKNGAFWKECHFVGSWYGTFHSASTCRALQSRAHMPGQSMRMRKDLLIVWAL